MKKVLLLFGGNSEEHFISCKSAKTILENIDREKYEVYSVGISKKNEWFFFREKELYLENGTWLDVSKKNFIKDPISLLKSMDIVFPIIHGKHGEDGTLEGMLDFFEIPYVGSKTLTSAVGMNKLFTKKILAYHAIPQVPFLEIKKDFSIEEIEQQIPYPMIVKPTNGGSSIGIRKAKNKEELESAIAYAFQFDNSILIEKFICARELECAILHGEVSTVGEIVSANEFYDYEAKYENENSKVIIPTALDSSIVKQIQTYAKEIFSILECSDYARIDFFYEEATNQIYFNEINTIPGFTKISMFPLLWKEKYSLKELITTLIEKRT